MVQVGGPQYDVGTGPVKRSPVAARRGTVYKEDMKPTVVVPEDLRGVFAVPPLARRADARRSIDLEESGRLVRHMAEGGITRFLYGGNAFLYHVTLAEYEELLGWLAGFRDGHWAIPGVGPSFGRAMDQAALVSRHRFRCVMALPCADPRDAAGLEAGLREVADAAGVPLVVYLKDEPNFGADLMAGLDAVARLVDAKICVAIKYAVVRADARQDAYLQALLERVDKRLVISGIGERPAIVHMRDFGLPGFTTGSGCLAPRLSQTVWEACARKDWAAAEGARARFLPLEDKRDAWGPARVLHAAFDLAGVARTGPIPPFVSAISESQRSELAPIARALHDDEVRSRRQA
jgi:dihydrodipicolinate synthase/N-acetylneuraminate lyase